MRQPGESERDRERERKKHTPKKEAKLIELYDAFGGYGFVFVHLNARS